MSASHWYSGLSQKLKNKMQVDEGTPLGYTFRLHLQGTPLGYTGTVVGFLFSLFN